MLRATTVLTSGFILHSFMVPASRGGNFGTPRISGRAFLVNGFFHAPALEHFVTEVGVADFLFIG